MNPASLAVFVNHDQGDFKQPLNSNLAFQSRVVIGLFDIINIVPGYLGHGCPVPCRHPAAPAAASASAAGTPRPRVEEDGVVDCVPPSASEALVGVPQ